MARILVFFLNRHFWFNPVYLAQIMFNRLIFFNRKKSVLFLDIDGTLWEDLGVGTILIAKEVNPRALATIRLAKKNNFYVFLVTNQTLFCYNTKIDLRTFVIYFWRTIKLCITLRVAGILVCHHHPNSELVFLELECPYRKPSQKMLSVVKTIVDFDPQTSIFVGDRVTDMACGALAGVKKCYLIQNSRMFEENIHSVKSMPAYLIFSVIQTVTSDWKVFD